jgi:ATP-dependent exoDNAse (exonuclease V) alpha subunit
MDRHIETIPAEEMEAQFGQKAPEAVKKQVESWKKTAERYQSEPETNEGRKELMARAKDLGKKSEYALAKYHNFEFGSAAFQIAIVLASSYLITGVIYLLWGAAGLGVVGLLFTAIGVAAPHALSFLGAH